MAFVAGDAQQEAGKRSEQLVSNWIRIRKLPDVIHYYRNTELRSSEVTLSSPHAPYGDGFVTCEEHSIKGASKALLSDALSVGWPELGIESTEMRKMFTRLANEGMEAFLKSRGLRSSEMALRGDASIVDAASNQRSDPRGCAFGRSRTHTGVVPATNPEPTRNMQSRRS